MSTDDAPDEVAARRASGPAADVAPLDQGGDAACWLGRVCDTCGALIEGSRGVPCWRCKTPWEPA